MNLAKPRVDIGLNTNNLDAMLAFWQGEARVPFDHVLPIRKGQKQHRHDLLGSVLKINHYADPLPARPPSGYRRVMIARPRVEGVIAMTDPDGNRLMLVAPGTLHVDQIGIVISVRDAAAHAKFYEEAMGLEVLDLAQRSTLIRAGETILVLNQAGEAPADTTIDGPGYRYITFQVFKCDEEHARILAAGGREAMAPTTLGTTARISMVRDPDGNWIEISQRASITGSLD